MSFGFGIDSFPSMWKCIGSNRGSCLTNSHTRTDIVVPADSKIRAINGMGNPLRLSSRKSTYIVDPAPVAMAYN